jgi:trimeric autotransporter adhesin
MTFPANLSDPTNGQWWFTALLLILIAPVLEEFVIRAGLHQALIQVPKTQAGRSSPLGIFGQAFGLMASKPWSRLFFVALIFGVLHLPRNAHLALAVIPAAMLLGWLFERGRSWKRCAVAHAAMNALWIGLAMFALPAQAADAWRGKSLYNAVPGPVSGFQNLSCANSGCHGVNPALGKNKINNGSNNPAVITSAINGNTGGMGVFKTGVIALTGAPLNATDIADIAAYIGNPTVTGPVAGAPIASISTASVGFAASNLGVASSGQTVTLSNTGTAALAVSGLALSGSNAADFAFSGAGACATGGSLAAAASCTVTLGFTPSAVGSRSASFTISHALGASVVALTGTGVGTAQANLSPGSLAFSSTILGTSATTQQVTLSNTGTASLTVSGVTSTVPSEFSVNGSGACSPVGGTLAPNTNCLITIGFTPTVLGNRAASLVVNHSLGQSTVGLSGTGAAVPQATLSINQALLNFGTITQGTTSGSQSVTISNSGTAALILSAITVSGSSGIYSTAGSSCATGVAIAPNASCTVNVSFSPNAIASFPSSLVLASNASNGNVSVTLQGTGAAVPAPVIAVSPGALAFGNQTLNVTSGTQFITVQNNGNAPATLSPLSLTGSATFNLLNPTACGASLGAGASCILQLQFRPTVTGAQTAALQVTSNAPGSPHSVSISGTGVAQPTPSPSLSQSAVVGFADTTLGLTDPNVATASAGNTGAAAYTLNQVSLSGANPGDFVLGGTCIAGKVVPSAGNCSLTVQFQPTAIGFRTARVGLVTDSGTTLGFDVEGNGKAVATIGAQLTATINFGAVLVGNNSSVSKATLNNTGNQALNVTAVNVAAPFKLALGGTCPSTLPFTLQAGVPCDFALVFTPTVASATAVTGNLTITTNAPNSPQITALSGTGSSVAVIVVTPAPVVPSAPPTTPPTTTSGSPPSTSPVQNQGATDPTTTPGVASSAATSDPNSNTSSAGTPKEAGAPPAITNIGAGGCTMSPRGNDISMVLLLLAALLTGLWRRSFSRSTSNKKDTL